MRTGGRDGTTAARGQVKAPIVATESPRLVDRYQARHNEHSMAGRACYRLVASRTFHPRPMSTDRMSSKPPVWIRTVHSVMVRSAPPVLTIMLRSDMAATG